MSSKSMLSIMGGPFDRELSNSLEMPLLTEETKSAATDIAEILQTHNSQSNNA
jgi:hypothetical protein